MSESDEDISAADFDAIMDGLEERLPDERIADQAETTVSPIDFQFPYEPYDIQRGFMSQLFKTLDTGKVGIFESPTGTGKSLSIICGSLAWLCHFEAVRQAEVDRILSAPLPNDSESNPSDDWVAKAAKVMEIKEERYRLQQRQAAIAKREKRLAEVRAGIKRNSVGKKRLAADQPSIDGDSTAEPYEDEDILPTNYDSDEETKSLGNLDEDEDKSQLDVTKIFFCSRTHSQLEQFAREIRKTEWAANVRVVNLGSRLNLCVNDAVKKLGSLSLINDRCLELKKGSSCKAMKTEKASGPKKSKSSKCEFYSRRLIDDLADRLLVEVLDIEETAKLGRQLSACAYFASRTAVPSAELVLCPYNILLNKQTRESCGIKLDGNVVIIDEAHNLLDSIASIHSVTVTQAQLTSSSLQLNEYHRRYGSRLKAKNLLYIKQLQLVLKNLQTMLTPKTGANPDARVMQLSDFLFDAGIDNINLFKLLRYLEGSELAKKLRGFVLKYTGADAPLPPTEPTLKKGQNLANLKEFLKDINTKPGRKSVKSTTKPIVEEVRPAVSYGSVTAPLFAIQQFIQVLTNYPRDGRLVVTPNSGLKFLLLNPAVYFEEIVQQARSIVLAGGTMEPIGEVIDLLLKPAGVIESRIDRFTCGHVIPAENLMSTVVKRGTSGLELNFNFKSRGDVKLLNEVGQIIANVCSLAPGGVVCFFPSYDYEAKVAEYLTACGWEKKVAAKKKFFREASGRVEEILAQFARAVKDGKPNGLGAVLFAVVGGRMSEGLNFADDLGRVVLVFGLPYPNRSSPELQEKLKFLSLKFGSEAAERHYENLCLKAVNQSIGRAIRHRNDFAAVLLVDCRYAKPSVMAKLPNWIRSATTTVDDFNGCMSDMQIFFDSHASK